MKSSICVISNPLPFNNKSSNASLEKFLNIACHVCKKVDVITSNNFSSNSTSTLRLIKRKKSNIFILNFIYQFIFSIKSFLLTFKCIKKGEKAFFWIADSMLFSFLAAKIKGAKIYYFVYGNILKIGNSKKNYHTFKRIKFMSENADYVCAEGWGVFDEWPLTMKWKQKKVIFLYNDLTCLKNEGKEKKIGMISRLSEGKHIFETIEAFYKLKDKYLEYSLDIVGDGDLFDKCFEIIKDLECNDRIHLLGWIDHSNLCEIIKKWKYCVLPTDSEGLPNSLIETMGFGVPNIITCVGGIKDIVSDGENGFFLDSTDADSIAKALDLAISLNAHEYEKISNASYKIILNRYNFNASVENFSLIFEESTK